MNGKYWNRVDGKQGRDMSPSITFYVVLTFRTMLVAHTPKVNNLNQPGYGGEGTQKGIQKVTYGSNCNANK